MTPQTPAEGVMLTRDFGDAKFFRVGCSCGDPDHDFTFEVEFDNENQCVTMHTWTTQKTDVWSEYLPQTSGCEVNSRFWSANYTVRKWFNECYRRITQAYKLLVHGYITFEQDIVMSEQQALNYANVIAQTISEIKATRAK